MYLKNDKLTVTIGNVVMRSSKGGSGKEFILDPTAVEGWMDGTNVRRNNTVRMNSHGDFPEKAEMSARLITFSGTAVANSIVALQEMRDALVGTLVDGSYGSLSVETKAGIRYSTVGLEGSTSWVPQSDTFASYKITFYAPDPFIYGVDRQITVGSSQTSSASGLKYILTYPLNYNSDPAKNLAGVITNNGNAESWPVFKITGDFYDGFTLSDNRDHRVTYTGMVSMQAPVTIDMGRGTAMQGGIDKTTFITDRNWFSVTPGQVIRPSFEPIKPGSGWCDIIIRDTWI